MADLSKKIILAASVFVIAEFIFSCSDDDGDGDSEFGASSFEYSGSSSSLADEDKPHCGYCSHIASINCSSDSFHCSKIDESFSKIYCTHNKINGKVFDTKKECEDSNPRQSSSSSYISSSSTK